MRCVCAQLKITLAMQLPDPQEGAERHPSSLGTSVPGRHRGWQALLYLCFWVLELTHYNLKQSLGTKWRRNLLHSENAKWHLPIATADLQLVLREMCHGKPTWDRRFQFLSLAFIGSFRIQWFFFFLFIAFQSDHSTVTRTFGAVNFSYSQHVLKLCFNIPE